MTIVLGSLCAPFASLAQTMPTPGAMPQGQQDMMKMLHLAAHNQLGVLQYCQAKGSINGDAIAVQQRLLKVLPPADVPGLKEAEAKGKSGVVQFGGTEVKLEEAAKSQGTTADAMCKQISDMLQAQAASLPK